MFYRIALLVVFVLFSIAESAKPVKCKCPILPSQNFTHKACALDWVSKVRINSWKVVNVKGQLINRYNVDHLQVFRGSKNLPTTLLVPVNCQMVLGIGSNYLLGGYISGTASKAQLYSTRCLSLYGPSPVWTVVPAAKKLQLKNLKCPNAPRTSRPLGLPFVPLS